LKDTKSQNNGSGTKTLGQPLEKLRFKNAQYTAKEIADQPELWLKTYSKIKEEKDHIQSFMSEVLDVENIQIVLTGAGTSAFIGEVLQIPFQEQTKRPSRALATTDLVTHFEKFIQPDRPLLLISFARSGNSPESMATVKIANQLCETVYHLTITCNASGSLATELEGDNVLKFLLPPETEDKSLAMTSSFTNMLLAGYLIAHISKLEALESSIEALADYGRFILDKYASKFQEISQMDFNRIVFLGSGPLLGVANESHLKVQELTDGKVVAKYDSFLGFRHGPKAVIDEKTLLVYLFSNNQYVHTYESDLVHDIVEGDYGKYTIGVMENGDDKMEMDLRIELPEKDHNLDENLLAVCLVLPAQMLGFFKSLQLGLSPDNPSVNGAISRVVQGVKIYPYNKDGIPS